MTLHGMTWDHPRAHQPLEAFAAAHPEVGQVRWARQSLADFEARPLVELAADHDLLVIDHPGLGSALVDDVLLPLDDVFTPAELRSWATASVGRTWESYHLDGHQWALPIDAATQVTVSSPDVAQSLPRTWHEVPDFARDHRTALGLAGPHALLTLLAMCADDDLVGDDLLTPDVAVPALELLQRTWAVSRARELPYLDPIEIHRAVADSRIDYCPLTYGYASYAVPAPGCRPVAWGAAPAHAAARPGSVLGGTGLAVTRRAAASLDAVRSWVQAFLETDVQASLVPAHGGQPAHRGAWDSAAVDAAWGGYYSTTRGSVDTAWIRPRVTGWPAFQDWASTVVRHAVTNGAPAPAAVAEVNDGHRRLTRSAVTGARTGVRS